jgi:hypothetical protein
MIVFGPLADFANIDDMMIGAAIFLVPIVIVIWRDKTLNQIKVQSEKEIKNV